eukprot:TRINITY_DN28044_c0_g1_i1.p1 TRINITY_DN28044_c0_g1~~TRINITY_DN28044_c0_g1_i1.p1  ORF type:complete len:987 (-),score=171.49 TRINITY_DN28044_c0_g1_i1:6-2945(-)
MSLYAQLLEKQARGIAHCPLVCMSIGCLIMFALVAVVPNMSPNVPGAGRNVYALNDWEGTKKHDAMLHAMDSIKIDGNADKQSIRSQDFIMINYKPDKDNVFTPELVKQIQKLEMEVRAYSGFDDNCMLVGGSCFVMSIVNYLTDDGSFNGTLPTDQATLDTRLKRAADNPMASFHFGTDFTKDEPQSPMTRSYFYLGLPLKGYKDQFDKAFEQTQKQSAWAVSLTDDVLDKRSDEYEKAGIGFFYIGGQEVLQKHINSRLFGDAMFAIGSFFFVWLYLWYHTESLFLASFGMMQVVLSFPAARTVSRYLFGVIWFDFLNLLLIFLLLGIGADSLFVTLDAFKQSNLVGVTSDDMNEEEKISARLAYTLKRACHAILTTSCTTAAAFFSNVFSQTTPTAGFGYFAGTMIIMNFAYSVGIYPAAICVHHYYMKERCSSIKCPVKYVIKDSAASVPESQEFDIKRYSAQERFYYNTVASLVQRFRIPLLLFSTALLGVGIGFASQLKGSSESPSFMPEDDPLQVTLNRMQCSNNADHCYMGAGSEAVSTTISMVWGIQNEPDRTGFSRFDDFTEVCENSVCGTHKWDTTFDAREEKVQQLILDSCDNALSNPLTKGDLPTGANCVMQDFKTWLNADFRRPSFPVPKDKFNGLFSDFINHVVIGPGGRPTRPARATYLDTRLVGIEKDGSVKYITINWNSVFTKQRVYPSDQIYKVYYRFMDFEAEVAAEFKKLPGGGNPYLCEGKGNELFLMMRVAKEFEDSVYRGISISVGFAFILLLLSTGNAIVGLLATLTICVVTATTLGAMVAYGWEMGIIESICAVLVVGFSVDYTVHFGIAYVERRQEHDGKYGLGSSRLARVTHSFFELGTSVFAGACTTLGASLFLFGCKVQFFFIFGVFMCTVIFLSFIYSHVLFMPLCSLIGPEGCVGDLSKAGMSACFGCDQSGSKATETPVEALKPVSQEKEKEPDVEEGKDSDVDSI